MGVGPQNHGGEAKIVEKRCQEAAWRGLGGLRRLLGGVLGGSWAQGGSKIARRFQNRKVGFSHWGPSWGPKSIKNRSWDDPKGDHFLDRFWD